MMMAMDQTAPKFPENWQTNESYDPRKHLIQLKGKDYLTVPQRLLWFIRDQRAMMVSGVAKCAYVIQTEIVEHDQQNKWAQFRTFIRDVLGNEVTMYGSEGVKDFTDYLEKASTKSVGRALLLMGYGTAFADEFDEGERVVDSPQSPKGQSAASSEQNTAPSSDNPLLTDKARAWQEFLSTAALLGLSKEQAEAVAVNSHLSSVADYQQLTGILSNNPNGRAIKVWRAALGLDDKAITRYCEREGIDRQALYEGLRDDKQRADILAVIREIMTAVAA
jgi:hypothetical protein